MSARMDLLRKFWEQELSKMIMKYVKLKNKTKKQKDFLQKLREIKDAVREGILKKYLEKCKNSNAI